MFSSCVPDVLFKVCSLVVIRRTFPKTECFIFKKTVKLQLGRKKKISRPIIVGWSTAAANGIWRNETKKQALNILCKICGVFSGGFVNKDGHPGLWLTETFSKYLLWNHLAEFDKTGQEASNQRHFRSLCFSSQSINKDGRSGLWLVDAILTSPLQTLNGVWRK